MQNSGSDWIIWKKNPPAGSHFGGVWEHQIRSARAVLGSLLKTHGSNLNDESIETIEHIADGTSEAAISPSNLLTMKSKVVMPDPRSFGTPGLYSRRYQISDLKTLLMNFGANGGRNFLLHFRHNQNGAYQDVT